MKKTMIKALIACMISTMMFTAAGCSGGSSNDSNQNNPFAQNSSADSAPTVPTTSTPVPTASTPVPTTSTPVPTASTPIPAASYPIDYEPSDIWGGDDEPEDYPIPGGGTGTPVGGTVNQAYVGYYNAVVSQEALQGLSAEQQQAIMQLINSSSLTLNADGSMIVAANGQQAAGTWSDNGDGTISMISGGQTLTYYIQDGIIYDPNDPTSYFQKS